MAVLARLMLTPDQVVTMNQLVESVWDGDEPAQPHVAVRSYISNLRRAVEPNRRRRSTDSCLASSPPGYRLAVDPASIDWVRFDRLVNDGRRHLATGDPASAVTMLRQAHALWLGVPFSGLPQSQFFAAHQARLSELREMAMELLFEALLAGGDHSSVAAEVESAIAVNPLRERLTELGMLAFYQSGRQSEALALGQKLRSRLLDELGVDPSPSIEAIELKILKHDRSLEPGAGTALGLDRPVSTASAVVELNAPIGGAPQPAVEATRPVGRRSELQTLSAIEATLAAGRSVTAVITGEQGSGKTTLVGALAHGLAGKPITVAWSRSVAGESTALWPWAQTVLSLLGSYGDSFPLEVTPDLAPLAALGPSVTAALGLQPGPGEIDGHGGDPPEAPPTARQDGPPPAENGLPETMLAVTRLLDRLSSSGPVVLFFEDLQWADSESVSLLSYAASTLSDRPIGFVLTWRETDLMNDSVAAGLRALYRLPAQIRMELEGLDRPAIRELGQRTGRALSEEETEDIHRRCGGNPLFVRELLAHPDTTVGTGRRWSILIDAVMDRVERLHPMATAVLSAASLFRAPFTVEALSTICEPGPAVIEQILALAVRQGLLSEDDQSVGAYRFRHPVVAEVLASQLLAAERARKHESVGRSLLETEGPSHDVAYHLSRSRSPEDRLKAARVALTLFRADGDGRELNELDDHVAVGTAAVEAMRRTGGDPDGAGFEIEALSYSTWRAWVDGEPSEWMERSRRWLQLALDHCPAAGRSGSRSKPSVKARNAQQPSDRGIDPSERLEWAIMNMIGSPLQPVGPTATADLVQPSSADIDDLSHVIERMAGESPARLAAQIHLAHLAGLGKPGMAAQVKVLREQLKVVSATGQRLRPEHRATVLKVLMSRFGDVMEPEAKLSMLADIGRLQPRMSTELFRIRHGYPALLQLGRSFDAERQIESALHRAARLDNPLLTAEARLLWIRHLLWTGQLDVADDEIDQTLADWAALGLVEPVPLIRQRRTLRLLRRRPVSAGHGPDTHHQLMVERAEPPELALRLARMGDERRANECLDGILDHAAVGQLSLADMALVAAASAVVGHEKAALTVYELLVPYQDQPVVRTDGSVVFGPASLYAGLAARAAGNKSAATGHLEAGGRAVERFGGSTASVDAIVNELQVTARSNRLPTNS